MNIMKSITNRMERDMADEVMRQVMGEVLLRYGEILTDDMYEDKECPMGWIVRICTIAYNNHIYYHKMEKLLK